MLILFIHLYRVKQGIGFKLKIFLLLLLFRIYMQKCNICHRIKLTYLNGESSLTSDDVR